MAIITEVQLQDGSIHQLGGSSGGNTYTLTKNGDTITLTGSGGDTSFVTDDNTTYTFDLYGGDLVISGSDGSQQVVPIPDNDTTYAIAVDGYQIVLTDNHGYSQSVTLPNGMFIVDDSNTLDEICGLYNDDRVIYYQYWANVSTLRLLPLAEIDCSDHALFAQIINDGTDTYLLIAMVDENDDWSTSAIPIETTDTTYTFSISGHTLTITPSTGSPTTLSLPDNNTTYSISGSGDTITLTGSDGSTSTVTISDDDTTYTLSKSGNTIILTGSDGSTTSVTDANDNTTYTISISGNVLTLTPSTGSPQTITLPDDDTTYTISKSGNTITLTGSDGSTSSVTVIDGDTTYTVSVSGHTLTLTGSDGSTSTATLPDDDTTYTISVSGNNLTLTPSSGTAQTITLPIPTKTSDLTNDSDFVSDANYVHTDNNFTTAEKNKLSGIEAGAEVNVQANWNQSDSTADDYIKNKPTIPTPPSPSSTTPLMDGTASVGSETKYARGDHRHPSDTSKQDTLVSGTNIKTINGNSILGSGDLQVGGSVISTDVPTADTIAEWDSDAHMNSEDMTSQEVDDFVDGLNVSGGGLLNMFYPVGSIYQTIDDGFNPNIRWGGTWELIEEGRFLQATETSATGGDTVSAGLPNIGGHLDIRATDYNASKVAWEDGVFIKSTTAGYSADAVHQQNGAVNVIRYNFDAQYYNSIYGNSTTVQPPAVKVYMWHRTA